MPVNPGIALAWPVMWLGLALAADKSAPDLELIEFLGSFETTTGTWPELAELLVTRPAPPASPAPPPTPPEESKR
jgi:hypothetical protein